MSKISTYANVEVGITTGANGYFTVPQSVVEMYQLQAYARPMVGRSVQVNSLCFTEKDWKKNLRFDAKANLLVFTPDAKTNGNEGTKAYIGNGDQRGIYV
jgi:adenine-specific DNA methylase